MTGIVLLLAMVALAAEIAPPLPPPPPLLPPRPMPAPVPVAPVEAPRLAETSRYATLADIVRAPTEAQFKALYPVADATVSTGASVSLNCAVKPDGALADCRASGPEGAGFVEATLAIAGSYRVRPLTAAELKAWPKDAQRRIRTRISWSPEGSGVAGVPILPLPAPTGPAPKVTKPDWLRRPSGVDMARYYPERAMRLEMQGATAILCGVTGEGVLENCVVDGETPIDMGFGEASVKMSRLFRMKPLDSTGRPVEGAAVRIPIVWALP